VAREVLAPIIVCPVPINDSSSLDTCGFKYIKVEPGAAVESYLFSSLMFVRLAIPML